MISSPTKIYVTYRHLYIRSAHLGKPKLHNYSFAPTRSITQLKTPSVNRTPTQTGIPTLTNVPT